MGYSIDWSDLEQRIQDQKAALLDTSQNMDPERLKFLVETYDECKGESVFITRAKLFEKVLNNKKIYLDGNPIVGSLAGGRAMIYAYPEWQCNWVKDDLDSEKLALSSLGEVRFSDETKEILKKAGYGKNRPLPQITILYNTSELHKAIAEAIQDAWINAFGADVRLQNQETKVFLADREAGKYQVARASWVADYSDPQNFLEVFSAEDNDGQYHSDEYNELIARIRTTPNGAARDALMHEAEKMIFDESLVMPLYFTTQPYVTNGTIQNYFWTTLGLVDFKKAYK